MNLRIKLGHFSWCMVLVLPYYCCAKYFVERSLHNGKDFGASNDTFSSLRPGNENFCKRLNASCAGDLTRCSVCKCKASDVWMSYQKGCQSPKYLEKGIGGYNGQ